MMNEEITGVSESALISSALSGPRFAALSGLSTRVRLQCNIAGSLDEDVIAYINGIIVGNTRISNYFQIGDYLDVPISYFPYPELPTRIHFLVAENEIATPFVINSHEDVMAILGVGEIVVENLHLDGGLLRGTIVNKTNGVAAPSAFVKLNGRVVRSVVLEPPRARSIGGTAAKWAVPIRPADFVNNGLIVDFHVAGIDYPLINYSYVRETLTGETQQLVELSEKVRQLEKTMALQIELMKGMLDRRLNVQQERLDAFIEYSMALMLDNLAGPSAHSKSAHLSDALKEFNLAADQALAGRRSVADHRTMLVPLDSEGLAFGWYDLESNEKGFFRWMGQSGLIRNPDVSRRIVTVKISVSQVYGSSEPMIRAFLDEVELSTSVTKEGDFFVITLTSPEGGVARGESLMLESFTSGCPATDRGTSDNRILSISAAEVRFEYAEREQSS